MRTYIKIWEPPYEVGLGIPIYQFTLDVYLEYSPNNQGNLLDLSHYSQIIFNFLPYFNPIRIGLRLYTWNGEYFEIEGKYYYDAGNDYHQYSDKYISDIDVWTNVIWDLSEVPEAIRNNIARYHFVFNRYDHENRIGAKYKSLCLVITETEQDQAFIM